MSKLEKAILIGLMVSLMLSAALCRISPAAAEGIPYTCALESGMGQRWWCVVFSDLQNKRSDCDKRVKLKFRILELYESCKNSINAFAIY